MKPDIDSDRPISLSAVANLFCILRDVIMGCIAVGVQLCFNWRSLIQAMVHLITRELLFNHTVT